MQCKEWGDANSELFKESHDEAVHKNSYKSRLYDLISASLAQGHMPLCRAAAGPFGNTDQPTREALIKSLSDFILAFLFNARNKSTRIASYLRRLMTQHWIKIHMKFDSAN